MTYSHLCTMVRHFVGHCTRHNKNGTMFLFLDHYKTRLDSILNLFEKHRDDWDIEESERFDEMVSEVSCRLGFDMITNLIVSDYAQYN